MTNCRLCLAGQLVNLSGNPVGCRTQGPTSVVILLRRRYLMLSANSPRPDSGLGSGSQLAARLEVLVVKLIDRFIDVFVRKAVHDDAASYDRQSGEISVTVQASSYIRRDVAVCGSLIALLLRAAVPTATPGAQHDPDAEMAMSLTVL